MDRKQVISGAAFQMDYAAKYIKEKYEADGYQVQKLRIDNDGENGILVQVLNTSKGIGSFLKSAIGCKTCATLKLLPVGNDLEIEVVAGRWLDKVAVISVSMIVLWPLFFTGVYGSYKQKKLLDKLFIDSIAFFAGGK